MNNETPIQIPTSPKAVIMSLLWSIWISLGIASLPFLFAYLGTRYTLDADTLHATRGTLTKKTQNIDLYRVKNVNAEDSLFGGGKLLLTMQDGTEIKLKYIAKPEWAAQQVRDRVRAEHKDRGIKYRENF